MSSLKTKKDINPLISVIVPVYKVEQSLHQCVDSVLSKSFKDTELILVDDGSPDNSPAICDAYDVKVKSIYFLKHRIFS